MAKSGWDSLQIVREKNRPTIRDYLPAVFGEFWELHGDRLYGDDGAILGGIGTLGGIPVTVISQVKGRNLKENQACNFAMPRPEGYRKALRLAHQAEKFHRPGICFIDTPGADATMGAEERGQGEAIARCLMEFMELRTPVISVVLGEGGSGGALALGVCDELAMLENAVYSVISPRGCASILWKDASREREAADRLRITAEDLKGFGICDRILPEPPGGAHTDHAAMSATLHSYLLETIQKYMEIPIAKLLQNRYDKFRKIGEFTEQKGVNPL